MTRSTRDRDDEAHELPDDAGRAEDDAATKRATYVKARADAMDLLLRKIHETGRQSLSPKEAALLARIGKELASEQAARSARIAKAEG